MQEMAVVEDCSVARYGSASVGVQEMAVVEWCKDMAVLVVAGCGSTGDGSGSSEMKWCRRWQRRWHGARDGSGCGSEANDSGAAKFDDQRTSVK